MHFSLATISVNGESLPSLEVDGNHYRLRQICPDLFPSANSGLIDLFADWATSFERLSEVASRIEDHAAANINTSAMSYLTPLQFPKKLILAGANYYEHMIKDAGKPDFKKADGMPVYFLKPPSTSLVGCGPTVIYPRFVKQLDWEIELAIVIGKTLKDANEAEAIGAIAAYTIGLDMSARDWQFNQRHPWKFDLFTGKAFDTSCPLGPRLVPAEFVDPANLRLQLRVNGQVKQDARSSDMIWSVGEQIAVLSEYITLEPGDVLLTGTPAGVGLASGEYLQPGDRIEAEIEGLGTLDVQITKS